MNAAGCGLANGVSLGIRESGSGDRYGGWGCASLFPFLFLLGKKEGALLTASAEKKKSGYQHESVPSRLVRTFHATGRSTAVRLRGTATE